MILVERTRTITTDGKMVQVVMVDGVPPYKIVYRRKLEGDKNDDSMTLSDFDESDGNDSE